MTDPLRRGKVIVLVGPDGAGKSTVARILREHLGPERQVLHLHHRPGRILPVSQETRADVTQPHSKSPYIWPVSVAKVLFLFVDFVVGHHCARRFANRGGWVIWERGWWDLAVDPLRYRMRAHPRLVPFLGERLASPDHSVLLEAPPALIHSRKTELALEEIVKQQEEWTRLKERIPLDRVDASQSIDRLAEEVRDIVR
jgi:thymidylate kinase